jgi:hypothetical protein
MSMTNETGKMSGQNKDLKAYSKPQLIQYGRVEEITKGTIGSSVDYGGQQQPK